jgi:hypothetical protein
MKNKKVYIVIGLVKNEVLKIIDVFENKKDAEKIAYQSRVEEWRNIIEKVIK